MTNKLGIIISFMLFTIHIYAQIPRKRLPQNINVPTYSHIFPTLSGDGNQMIFLTNYTNSEGFETKYSTKNGAESWEDPEPLVSLNRPGLDHIGSYCLSYDGNYVVFASRRTPTIGNFDIFISEKVGNYWSQPKNPGKPLNSLANEGNPCLSPDGKSIYFTRCETMDANNKSNCSIYVSHRITSTRWSEPEKLPDIINNGHTTTPRIMADNKTLIFASKRSGGKGKLDLYQSELARGTWSKPNPLDFINTSENDEYVSIPARGDIIYFTGKHKNNYNIFKAIIPEHFRPKKVLMLTGTVSYTDGMQATEDVIIQAFDVSTGQVYTTAKLRQHDSSYTIFLPEGTAYDISAFPQKGGHSYASRIIDLKNMLNSRKEEWTLNLASVKNSLMIPLSTIRFKPYTAELSHETEIEIKRISGFLKSNPDYKIEIGAFIDSIYTDTIPSNDLTEMITDTVFVEFNKIPDADSIFANQSRDMGVDSISNTNDTISTPFETDTLDFASTFDSDTMNILSPIDSVQALGFQLYEEKDDKAVYYKVKYCFHNDRTEKQADAVRQRLIEAGVPEHLITSKGYGDNWSTDHAAEERNYWIELRLMR
jgi:hypothetical protein